MQVTKYDSEPFDFAQDKRGAETVDKRFLESLDLWRGKLAVDIAGRNKNLDEDQMNTAVQLTRSGLKSPYTDYKSIYSHLSSRA